MFFILKLSEQLKGKKYMIKGVNRQVLEIHDTGNQYFEKAKTYVNAYSMLSCSAEAFVKATCGEIEFKGKSPVKL